MEPVLIPCVGAIVRDGHGRLLLVSRTHDPGRGQWSVPGGRVEPGETDAEATRREVAEETGLRVVVGDLAGRVERAAPGGGVFAIRDYLCTLDDAAEAADLRAGSDAGAAGWFTEAEVLALDCVRGLVPALRAWGVLPAADDS